MSLPITHINGEPVEEFGYFESARFMDILWIVGCPKCGRKHRMTLIRFDAAIHGWEVVPVPGCLLIPVAFMTKAPGSGAGWLYRVINPLTDEPADQRQREAVR